MFLILVPCCCFRWKGENVATSEVADILTMAGCILEANVYGVKVEGKNTDVVRNSHVEVLSHILKILYCVLFKYILYVFD